MPLIPMNFGGVQPDGTNWVWTVISSAPSAPALKVNTVSGDALYFPIPQVHNGATLSYVSIQFYVGQIHGAAPGPTELPSIIVVRIDTTNQAVGDLGTATQYFTPAPLSGPSWYNSGLTQSLTYTCTVNNVIDNTKFLYYGKMLDESGVNALPLNVYMSMIAYFTNITNMQFP